MQIKYFRYIVIMCFLAFLNCCNSASPQSKIKTGIIGGRDSARTPLYRVKLPAEWKEIGIDPLVDLADSTQPIAQYELHEGCNKIQVVIHNFPFNDQIAPQLQVERWQKQFNPDFPLHYNSVPQAFSGYTGLLFEGTGRIKNSAQKVMAWALNIGTVHYRTFLSNPSALNLQKRADVTIKINGPPELMQKHKATILEFARSFELIEEIPTRS